jgi:hypothetical protein
MPSHLAAHGGFAAALRAFALVILIAGLQPGPAHADAAADQAFIQRLIARQIIAGVAVSGDTATIQALAPFVGADDQSMSDVARVLLRSYAWNVDPPTVTKVVIRDPTGRVIGTYTKTAGLVRS